MKKILAAFALIIFAVGGVAHASGGVSTDKSFYYLDTDLIVTLFYPPEGTESWFFPPGGEASPSTNASGPISDHPYPIDISLFPDPGQWIITVTDESADWSSMNLAEQRAEPGFLGETSITVYTSRPAQSVAPGDLHVSQNTPTDMLASVSAIVTDPGLLSVAVIAVALPLAFWVIHRLIGLLPARRRKK